MDQLKDLNHEPVVNDGMCVRYVLLNNNNIKPASAACVKICVVHYCTARTQIWPQYFIDFHNTLY